MNQTTVVSPISQAHTVKWIFHVSLNPLLTNNTLQPSRQDLNRSQRRFESDPLLSLSPLRPHQFYQIRIQNTATREHRQRHEAVILVLPKPRA